MFFFDLDGTLLDSTGIWMQIDVDFLGSRGISPVPEDYTYYVTHHSPRDAAQYTKTRYALAESPEEIQSIWSDMAHRAYAAELPLKSGAGDFLRACARKGIPMGLITSCIPSLCRAALAHHGIEGLFREVFTTADTGLEKNSPQLFHLAARRLGVEPERCTMFDDSPGYCAAAKEAGFRVVGVYDRQFEDYQGKLRALCQPGDYVRSFEGLSPERFLSLENRG